MLRAEAELTAKSRATECRNAVKAAIDHLHQIRTAELRSSIADQAIELNRVHAQYKKDKNDEIDKVRLQYQLDRDRANDAWIFARQWETTAGTKDLEIERLKAEVNDTYTNGQQKILSMQETIKRLENGGKNVNSNTADEQLIQFYSVPWR